MKISPTPPMDLLERAVQMKFNKKGLEE